MFAKITLKTLLSLFIRYNILCARCFKILNTNFMACREMYIVAFSGPHVRYNLSSNTRKANKKKYSYKVLCVALCVRLIDNTHFTIIVTISTKVMAKITENCFNCFR